MLFYIKASEVTSSWAGNIRTVGKFAEGDDEYHPMLVQNRQLYIGDGRGIGQVDDIGIFTPALQFTVEANETITTLKDFDVDILVGTSVDNYGRILRWDGISDSWYAQDIVPEDGGVRAFMSDDNFVYASAGYKGRLYYYNGSNLQVFKKIPEVYDSEEVLVRPNAVGFFRNSPVFGLSKKTGTSILQGVYAIGSYSEQYSKVLTLDFPVPTKEFSGVDIGAILVADGDLYVAYKTATETGVAKLGTTRYDAAYFETRVLTPGESRHQIKTLTEALVPYAELPSNTGGDYRHQERRRWVVHRLYLTHR
jgi:hypothetical protein